MNTELHLYITVRPTVTVLPRCLQILSRRGFVLTNLKSHTHPDDTMAMACTVVGPERWHQPIIRLLERLTDVVKVETAVSAQAGGRDD